MMKEVRAMGGNYRKETQALEEGEKVAVPVIRRQIENKVEQEINEEPQPVKQQKIPRRWYIY
jgi:hypothetical protein